MIDLILLYLPYYIGIGFILATSVMLIVSNEGGDVRSLYIVHGIIMAGWLPLIFVAFGMLIRDYLTDLKKAGDSQ